MKRNSPAAVAEEVRLLLRRNGIAVCFEWVKQSIEYLSRKGLNFNNAESLSAKVYLLFLESDLHEISSGDGILPHNVHQIESGMLSSSNDIIVLQVDEVVNVGSSAGFKSNFPADDDENIPVKGPSAGSSRMLKMFLTDGRRQMIGIELRPMPSFSLEILPGCKVKVRASCTPMRRGVAMLSPECIVLLEGSVERLIACTAASSGATAAAVIAHALQLPVQQSLLAAGGIHHPPQNHPQLIDPVQNKKVQQQNHQQRQQQQQQRLQIEVGKSLDQSLNQSQRLNPYCSAVDLPLVYGSASEHALAPLARHAAPNTNGETYQVDAAAEYQSSIEVVMERRSLEEPLGSIQSVLSSPGHSATNQILDLCSPSSPSPSSPVRIISNQPLPTTHAVNVNINMSHDAFYDELNLNAVTSSPSISTPPQGITVRLAKTRYALSAENVHTSSAIVTTLLSSVMTGEAAASAGGAGSSGVRRSSSSSSSSSIGGQSEPQSNLTYFALDVVAAWLSTPVGLDISCNLPAGDFVVRGTAVNIRKFKVAPSEGYVVLLSLEGEAEANGESMNKASAFVPALVSNDLCSKYLQTTAKEYLLNLKDASKEEIKAIKTSYSLKFRDFRGTFRARLLPCNPHSKISQSDQAPPNTIMDAHAARSCGASSQGDRMLLLLVDFYCSEMT